jgi:hypothetical protein
MKPSYTDSNLRDKQIIFILCLKPHSRKLFVSMLLIATYQYFVVQRFQLPT